MNLDFNTRRSPLSKSPTLNRLVIVGWDDLLQLLHHLEPTSHHLFDDSPKMLRALIKLSQTGSSTRESDKRGKTSEHRHSQAKDPLKRKPIHGRCALGRPTSQGGTARGRPRRASEFDSKSNSTSHVTAAPPGPLCE